MRKRRLSKPLHAAFCIAAVVLIAALVRLYCGPPAALSPRAALRRTERQSLLPRETVEYRWDRLDFTFLAVREPKGEWRVFQCCPFNTVTYIGPELKPKGLRLLRFYLNRSSVPYIGREVPWEGTSFFSINYSFDSVDMLTVNEVHLLFENTDPAAQRAELRCTSVTTWEEWRDTLIEKWTSSGEQEPQQEPHVLKWSASAERLTPRLFDLTLTLVNSGGDRYSEERWDAMCAIADGGRSPKDSTISLEGEVIWYDAEGRELYRQKLDFREDGETEAGP